MTTTMTKRPEAGPPGGSRGVAPLALVMLVVLAAAFMVAYLRSPATTPPDSAPQVAPADMAPALVEARAPEVHDWRAVVREVLTMDTYLRAHPNPTQIAQVMDPANPGYSDAVAAQEQLAQGKLRYDPAPEGPRVEDAVLLDDRGTAADVQVRWTSPRYRVVDDTGAVVVDTPSKTVNTVWHLVYSDGQWRILGTSAA